MPGILPIEGDLAESWSAAQRPHVRVQAQEGRALASEAAGERPRADRGGREVHVRAVPHDQGQPEPLRARDVDKIEAIDKYTVSSRSRSRSRGSSTAGDHVDVDRAARGRRAVRRSPRPEACIGTGPWMLERYEPNVRLTFVRNPNYFVSGLPYADGVDVSLDDDPASRFAAWLAGQYDFAPEYGMRAPASTWTSPKAQARPQTADFTWSLQAASPSMKLDQEPFKDVRVRRAPRPRPELARRSSRPTPGPKARACRTRGARRPQGMGDPDRPAHRRGPAPLRAPCRGGQAAAGPGRPPTDSRCPRDDAGLRPRLVDVVQVSLRNWKGAGIEAELQAQGIRRLHVERDLRQVREAGASVFAAAARSRQHLYAGHARRGAELRGRRRSQAHRDDQAAASHARRAPSGGRSCTTSSATSPSRCTTPTVRRSARWPRGCPREELRAEYGPRLRRPSHGGVARPLNAVRLDSPAPMPHDRPYCPRRT